MNVTSRTLLPLFLALSFLSLPACATAPAEPIHGQVVEEGTGKPIAGAIVVARWTEARSIPWADGQTVCVHVESASTDDQGRYTLPRYKDKEPTLTDSHKPGYERSEQYYQTGSYIKHVDILKPFTGTRGERLEYLSRTSSATRCGESGDSKKNLSPLYRALFDEAKNIADTTVEEKKTVEFLLYEFEIVELGYEQATKRHLERPGY